MKQEEKLKEAKKLYETANSDQRYVLESLFPELKESEDERIRKAIIRNLEYLMDRAEGFVKDELKERIAWLEKQGNANKEYWRGYREGKKEILDKYSELEKQGEKFQYWKPSEEQLEALDYAYNSCPDTERGNYYEGVLGTIIDDLHKLSEKQSEQKPANNVEPKFKVGDWITNGATKPAQISSIEDDMYYTHNGTIGGDIESMDKDSHLWTISDAKDGDVLYSPCCKLLWIYKDDNSCYVGNNLSYNENCVVVNSSICIPSDVCPATKEQRDTLMKAMTDSGYTFDFEKKELKKIEQNPVWSEVDKNFMYDTLSNLTELKDRHGEGYGNVGKCIKWLKSLKERVQPKHEWSEEDVRNIQDIDSILFYDKSLSEDTCMRLRNWLESLKQRLRE